jgi:hypothetical protein
MNESGARLHGPACAATGNAGLDPASQPARRPGGYAGGRRTAALG